MGIRKKLPAAKGVAYRKLNGLRSNGIHLFLLSPPLSGSTAAKELIKTSPNVTCFPWIGEGQLLPGARKILAVRNRWDRALEVDWASVKEAFYSFWSPAKPIRFDKSPPHIFRVAQLEREFSNSYFLILIRNPYAVIQGFLRREWPFDEYGPQPFVKDKNYGVKTPGVVAEFWVKTAQAQIWNLKNIERKLFFTYENLTDNSELVIQKIIAFLPQLKKLTTNTQFGSRNITEKPVVGLKNFNEMKISKLSGADIAEINKVLIKHEDVLDFFHYEMIRL